MLIRGQCQCQNCWRTTFRILQNYELLCVVQQPMGAQVCWFLPLLYNFTTPLSTLLHIFSSGIPTTPREPSTTFQPSLEQSMETWVCALVRILKDQSPSPPPKFWMAWLLTLARIFSFSFHYSFPFSSKLVLMKWRYEIEEEEERVAHRIIIITNPYSALTKVGNPNYRWYSFFENDNILRLFVEKGAGMFFSIYKIKKLITKTMKLTCLLRLVLGENQQVPYLWRCSPSECSFWIFLGIWGSYTQCFWCISQEQWCFHCFFCSCQNSRCHLSIMGSHSRWGQPVFCWLVLQYVFFLLFLSFIELVHQFINLFFQLWLLVALLPQDSLPLEQCLSLLSSLAAKKYSA